MKIKKVMYDTSSPMKVGGDNDIWFARGYESSGFYEIIDQSKEDSKMKPQVIFVNMPENIVVILGYSDSALPILKGIEAGYFVEEVVREEPKDTPSPGQISESFALKQLAVALGHTDFKEL